MASLSLTHHYHLMMSYDGHIPDYHVPASTPHLHTSKAVTAGGGGHEGVDGDVIYHHVLNSHSC